MLEIIHTLCARLNEQKVVYCHWKSTAHIAEALAGKEDLDLLVMPPDRNRFDAVVAELAFFPVHHAGAPCSPLCHYIGLDQVSGVLVHLHVYYQLRTGGGILKSHRLPLENYFLRDTRLVEDAMPAPAPEKDLGGLVLRRMIALGSLIEYAMLRREGMEHLYSEYDVLSDGGRADIEQRAIDGICAEMPFLRPSLLRECFDCIKQRKSYPQVAITAFRVRLALSHLALYPAPIESLIRTRLLAEKALQKFVAGRLWFRPQRGGKVITVTGGDASGKSTLVAALAEWLGGHFAVRQSHAGIPGPTALTFLPHLLLPLARRLLPHARSTHIETEMQEGQKKIVGLRRYVFALRSIMLAYERLLLLNRLFRQAARGEIILVDRYPCRTPGAPDSPQINAGQIELNEGGLLDRLRRWELQLYHKMPTADLIIRLDLPKETALKRNAERVKAGNESDDYILRRHRALAQQDFSYCPHVTTLDAREPKERLLQQARQIIWRHL